MHKKLFDFENGCHRVQHSQRRHSIVNINLYTIHANHFALALTVLAPTVSAMLTFQIGNLEDLGQGHEV